MLTIVLGGFAPAVQAGQPAAPPATPVVDTLPWWQDAVCYEIFVRSFFYSDGDNPEDGIDLSAVAGTLPSSEYALDSLLGADTAEPRAVGADGSFVDFDPLPTLAAQTGYVFELVPRSE